MKNDVNSQNELHKEDSDNISNPRNKKNKNFTETVNKLFANSMSLFLSIMVILVFINAVMRYAFHSSIPVSEEYARFFFMWTVFFGVIAAFRDKAHVSVTIVTDYLKGKAKIYVYLIAQAITIIILGLLLIGGITYTISASTYNTVATGINFGIVVSGFVIMIVGSLGIIINDTITKIKEIKEGE